MKKNNDRYQRSVAQYLHATKVIPLGSQTFTKSITQYPLGSAPLYVTRGKGSRLWDVDGNEYLDLNSALASVTLGYCDPDVDQAVQEQLKSGVSFSLSHPLEAEVAQLIVDLVPCAEQVRFGKNGSDATAGAIRIARAYTKRDRVAVCGYHGWQDWYIGSTARHLGVPQAVRDLTHTFQYNQADTLKKLLETHPREFAAVILEPMNVDFPLPGFLETVRSLCDEHGALLIFDETITGFRYAKGGAQEAFGVTPDLATLGKGLGNGYPLSAVAGKAKYMKLMEEIFFSFTFGGEAMSLAAAKAVLTKIKTGNVVERIKSNGEKIGDIAKAAIREFSLEKNISYKGHPSWSFLVFADSGDLSQWDLKTLFLQEVFAEGVITIGTHNVSFAHNEQDFSILAKAYGVAFEKIKLAVQKQSVEGLLHCETLKPLFRVR